jgi:hypothetical protein
MARPPSRSDRGWWLAQFDSGLASGAQVLDRAVHRGLLHVGLIGNTGQLRCLADNIELTPTPAQRDVCLVPLSVGLFDLALDLADSSEDSSTSGSTSNVPSKGDLRGRPRGDISGLPRERSAEQLELDARRTATEDR